MRNRTGTPLDIGGRSGYTTGVKVLVTGGAGHLGANLLRRLLADGNCEIRALARRNDNNEGITSAGVEMVFGDLRDPDSLRAACKGIDRVYHVAAQISTVGGKEEELFQNNVIGVGAAAGVMLLAVVSVFIVVRLWVAMRFEVSGYES